MEKLEKLQARYREKMDRLGQIREIENLTDEIRAERDGLHAV